jgi:hypothetical protein
LSPLAEFARELELHGPGRPWTEVEEKIAGAEPTYREARECMNALIGVPIGQLEIQSKLQKDRQEHADEDDEND